MAGITLRPPTFSLAKPPTDFEHPSIPWLTSTSWHVTHSTLPMWKSKRNVRIEYTTLDPSKPSVSKENTDRIDDQVTYQSLGGRKVHTVHGVDKAAGSDDSRGEWDWRGRGWLMVASSHWEVLGWGEEECTGNKWVVTVFAKTFFTPGGLDIYSGDKSGLQPETLEKLKGVLQETGDEDLKKMAGDMFEIRRDDGRNH